MFAFYPAFTPAQAAAYTWMAGATFWATAIEMNAAILRGLHATDMATPRRRKYHSTPV